MNIINSALLTKRWLVIHVVFARFSTEMHGVDVKDCTKVKKAEVNIQPSLTNAYSRELIMLNYLHLL